ncbi:putative DNA mismatch repair protein MutS, core [Septoria linicola]|nr:putative DNA mismatch repair protein MutS, core [Septoria linicola]
MRVRALPVGAACKLHRSLGVATHSPAYAIDCVRKRPWLWTQWRGAKTTTTVKASSLRQGVLPALSPQDLEAVPEKTYPTVLQQHLNNVRKFKDCIVLTRVGDFYEMYFDQVEEFAPLVNLKVARRATTLGDVAMAGFQHTQLERYLKMFVQDLGKQVAISEQVRIPENERNGKNGTMLFDRRVTRVVTAGTLIDESFMDPFENNYLLAVHFSGALPALPAIVDDRAAYERYRHAMKIGLSWVDLSSGDFFTQTSDLASLPSLAARIGPKEVVLDAPLEAADQSHLQRLISDANLPIRFHSVSGSVTTLHDWQSMLERPIPAETQSDFTVFEVSAGSLLLDYVQDKIRDQTIQLQPPARRTDDEYMAIDKQSLRNLEVRATSRDGTFQGSLLHAVRHTVTKSGARLLSQRIVSPSMSLSVINDRLDLVQEMCNEDALREDTIALLRCTHDTCRLMQKFSIGKGDADDLLGLARTVGVMQKLSTTLHEHILNNQDRLMSGNNQHASQDFTFLWDILGRLDLDSPAKAAKNIQDAIDEVGLTRQHMLDDAIGIEAEQMAGEVVMADNSGVKGPSLTRRRSKSAPVDKSVDTKPDEIWIMRREASPTLKRAHDEFDKLIDARLDLVAKLRKELRSESLTLKWSAMLGHFCHIKGRDAKGTLAALEGARIIGSTKSTKSFYLSDWTHLGVCIDDAKLRIRTEEERVFGKLRAEVLENLMKLRRNAAVLDELDVACSSAVLAKERNLVRPLLNSGTSHRIIGGRHPTVDAGLKDQGRTFTTNDCSVGDAERIYLITGPNMAGKSTYLRQNALITILAQTGCFVPAEFAEIGLVDRIFSRVGSADNLFQDQSTFMVEMLEAADILKQATPHSFVIMDEVGRGTTPEDGIAVGYACLHHLHNANQSRTLFATHFHALADMTRDFAGLACYCTNVVEQENGSWTYAHELRKGVNRESHALKVARLAGLPESAIEVAEGVLAELHRPRGTDEQRYGSSEHNCQTTGDHLASSG